MLFFILCNVLNSDDVFIEETNAPLINKSSKKWSAWFQENGAPCERRHGENIIENR